MAYGENQERKEGTMIVSHNNRKYRMKWNICGDNKWNGAFYYSKEIIKNIKPLIETDRSWITVNIRGEACDHALVFVHNNKQPENYEWLKQYKDLVLVCGIEETCEKLKHLGTTIHLPLSIDVEDVKQYAAEEKDRGACFAGRAPKRRDLYLPEGIDFLEGMPRTRFLKELARYKEVYAVGRTAIEAKALGCKIKAYDPRFPDPKIWKVLDNKDAAKILQEELDKIDRPEKITAQEEKETPLEKVTKAELIERAEVMGLKINTRAKKAEIIKAIQNARG